MEAKNNNRIKQNAHMHTQIPKNKTTINPGERREVFRMHEMKSNQFTI